MKQERPGMMHLKKVTKTVDYYSCGLSGDARSQRGEARRPGFPLSAADAPGRGGAGRGPLAKGARGAREGHRPGRGSHPFPLSPRGWRGQLKEGGRGSGAPAAAPWPCPGDSRARGRGRRGAPPSPGLRALSPRAFRPECLAAAETPAPSLPLAGLGRQRRTHPDHLVPRPRPRGGGSRGPRAPRQGARRCPEGGVLGPEGARAGRKGAGPFHPLPARPRGLSSSKW